MDWNQFLKDAEESNAIKYESLLVENSDLIPVWAFSVVQRNDQFLSYRVGRYRDNRDAFANKRSIGFPELVGAEDRTLFSEDNLGVTDCGLHALLTDLDLSSSAFKAPDQLLKPVVSFVLVVTSDIPKPVLLFVMRWQCPDWFEPTKRRLSLNDVQWMSATVAPNSIEDFEPWSAAALQKLIIDSSRAKSIEQKNQYRENCIS